MIQKYLYIALILAVSGCSALPDWLGEAEKPPLPGKRISVLEYKSQLTADRALQDIPVTLSKQLTNQTWPIQYVHKAKHLSLSNTLNNRTNVSAGKGSSFDNRLTSTPIIANQTVFTIDGRGVVSARSVQNLKKTLWKTTIESGEIDREFLGFIEGTSRKDFLGGNIAYLNGRIFVTTANGIGIALDAQTGAIIWARDFKIPIASPPVGNEDKVVFITSDNKLYVLNSHDGSSLWTHSGISENTTILGSASPAINNQYVIVPYSSGELYAFNINTGKLEWAHSLTHKAHYSTSLFSLNDIDATPVIQDGIVYSVSHEGLLSVRDINTGKKRWEQNISSINTPWVAGEFLYIITTNDELLCISTIDGRIKWVAQLPTHESGSRLSFSDKKGDKITWSGPILAGERLWITGSHGTLLAISPYDGTTVSDIDIKTDNFLPPIVVNNVLYLLDNDANLTALY